MLAVVIDLGRNCNRDCDFCLNDPEIKFELSTEEVKKVLKDGKKYDCDILGLTGGEPFLRKDLYGILDDANSLGYDKIRVQTNGDFLTDEIISKIIDNKVHQLLISYHDSNKEKVFRVLGKLIELGISVMISYVINKKTYKNMLNFLKEVYSFRKNISIYFLFMITKEHIVKNNPDLMLSYTEAFPFIDGALDFCDKEKYDATIEGVPYCVLGKHKYKDASYGRGIDKHIPFTYTNGYLYKNLDINGIGSYGMKERFDYCYGCIYFNECSGPWRNYKSFFKDEEELIKNIKLIPVYIDKSESKALLSKKEVPYPLIIRIEDEKLVQSFDYINSLKKRLNFNNDLHNKLITTNFPICWSLSSKEIIPLPFENVKNNGLCMGCFFESKCQNKYVSQSNSDSIKKFYEVPNELKIEVTNNCNLDCSFCFNKKTIKQDNCSTVCELDKKTILKLLDEAKQVGIERVRFTGGEPLIREDILEITKYANGIGLYVRMNSNLLLLEEKQDVFDYVDDLLVSFNNIPFLRDVDIGVHGKKLNNLKVVRSKVGVLSVSIIIYDDLIVNKFDELMRFCEGLDVDNIVFLYPYDIENKKVDYGELSYFLFRVNEFNKHSLKNYIFGNPLPYCMFEAITLDNIQTYGFLSEYGVESVVVDPEGNLRMNYVNPRKFANLNNISLLEGLKKLRDQLNYWANLNKKCINCINLIKCGGLLNSENSINKYYDFLSKDFCDKNLFEFKQKHRKN